MWARTHMGRSGHVDADATAGTVMAGADVFPKMTVSQNLVLG
jgi:ABC-type branched-subunit amino acid transport system ATPase component